MIDSRKIEDLDPYVGALARTFITKCKEQSINIILTSTYRDIEMQNKLYAKGRTTEGSIVTNAKGGESFHNFKVAFDVVPVVDGKAVWNDMYLWKKIGEIGESIGLEWAGRWKSFNEKPHFQFTGGLSLKDFRAGKRLPVIKT